MFVLVCCVCETVHVCVCVCVAVFLLFFILLATSKKRVLSSRKPKGGSSRKPLQEPNTPKQPENFNISAVSSARRSGQKINSLTSFEDENNDVVRNVRKRRSRRNVSKSMVLSDSDQD